ncbi:DUF1811 family protein [Alicyclobacillus sp. SO9]|uniref:DUF1811 family protein n=1 Tax=Alicyclobacillus sp. SO9 TaxID=2665646 RepID=UPI0018E8BEC9|nr:DUF1811 family protein [Alicyclobacillus sp. SO9]QQE80330.1 DUF1811 family protein [Alicyclobacillus sp. SO9]
MLYSDMTPSHLENEMKQLQQQGQRAYDEANWSEYEINMHKWYLAKSYLIQDNVHLKIGRTYSLAEAHDRLTVNKLKGIMAWGIRESDAEEIAVPIAMLEEYD